jgi:hypothetical protein
MRIIRSTRSGIAAPVVAAASAGVAGELFGSLPHIAAVHERLIDPRLEQR